MNDFIDLMLTLVVCGAVILMSLKICELQTRIYELEKKAYVDQIAQDVVFRLLK